MKKRVGHKRGLTELTVWMVSIVFHPWMIGLGSCLINFTRLHVVRSDIYQLNNIPCQYTLSPSRGKFIKTEIRSTSRQVRPRILVQSTAINLFRYENQISKITRDVGKRYSLANTKPNTIDDHLILYKFNFETS